MFRKMCMLVALMFAVTGAFFAPQALAQGEPTCRIVFVDEPVGSEDPSPVGTVVPTTDSDSAQPLDSADATAVHSCADAVAYPGPFTNMPVTPSSPYSAPVGLSGPVLTAPVAETAPVGSGLAHSGTETFVLAYLGTGLLAFGAVALGIRRGSAPE